jgi:hypothetical protein
MLLLVPLRASALAIEFEVRAKYDVPGPLTGRMVLDFTSEADDPVIHVLAFELAGSIEEEMTCTSGGFCTIPFYYAVAFRLEQEAQLRWRDGHLEGEIPLIFSWGLLSRGGQEIVRWAVNDDPPLLATLVGEGCLQLGPSNCQMVPVTNQLDRESALLLGMIVFPDGERPEWMSPLGARMILEAAAVSEPGTAIWGPIAMTWLIRKRRMRSRRTTSRL